MRGCYYNDGVINRFSLAVTKMFQLGRYQQMGQLPNVDFYSVCCWFYSEQYGQSSASKRNENILIQGISIGSK